MEGALDSSLSGWLIFGLMALIAIVGALRLWLQERRGSREKASFFKQAEDVLSFPEPTEAINEYEVAREDAFDDMVKEGKADKDAEDLPEGALPETSWLRRISADHKKKLKLLLLRRALANVPRWAGLSQEINAKFRLYRHGLLSEETWSSFARAQDSLQAELDYLRLEAECLEPQWGDRVLKDAMLLYRLQQTKEAQQKEQEQEAKKRAAMQKQELIVQQQKKDAMERKAEKRADSLIKEEEGKQKKKASR
ncbi:hypothetical protein BESB_061710 [Besnoitia besnoiti]|uniref:Preprotein translocase subunit Sec66 n=1 Tax=Besnoitia besnoiti TaxID=94643 RepID=A0A2A9MDK8_BESBE|nr:hypothetical protein BESB_061710 [Besnoitia besnoiti]PFH35284.1 hypothetical protein BESB_061710 [Besnoitia besnoiti]